MKKSVLKSLGIVLLLLVLFFPISNIYKDGGTRTYTALTYKVFVWNHMLDSDATKTGMEVHLFPNNFRRLDDYLTK